MHQIYEILCNVTLECIIHIDKSALEHRMTSSRLYYTVNLNGRGMKRSKEQITVVLGVSASGEKFTMQIITKSDRSGALKDISDISKAFGIISDHQVKA